MSQREKNPKKHLQGVSWNPGIRPRPTFPVVIFMSATLCLKCQVHDPWTLHGSSDMGPKSRGCYLLGRAEDLESTQAMQCCKCVGLRNSGQRWCLKLGNHWGNKLVPLCIPDHWNPGCCSSEAINLPTPEVIAAAYLLFCLSVDHKTKILQHSSLLFPWQRQPGPSQRKTKLRLKYMCCSKNAISQQKDCLRWNSKDFSLLFMTPSYPPKSITTLSQYSAKAVSD